MEIINIILDNTYSLTSLKHRLKILKAYFLKAFFGNNEQTPALSSQDLNWLHSLPEAFYRQFNKDNVYNIFDSLENLVAKITPLTAYLAFEPDETTLAQIGTYARKLFGHTLLLDIKLDPKLIAGCALSWKGIYKDYSLHARIKEKRVEILDSFKKFLR